MNSQLWWHVARASGLVAWALSMLAVLWGLAVASKAQPRRPGAGWFLDLHRWLGSLTVVFTAVHVVALLLDDYVTFRVVDLLVPFASEWRPAAVAWGIVALYLLVAVQATSLLRRRLPTRVWRRIHLLSFPLALSATIHLFQAGTDAASGAVVAAILGVVFTVVVIGYVRVLIPRRPRRGMTRARP